VANKKKRNLNEIIGTVIVVISWLIFIAVIIGSMILWLRSGNSFYLITGLIGALGVLFNLSIVYRERARKQN
jgi:hypothetical protein